MAVRAGTPAEIVSRLSDEVANALRQPDVAERAASLGLDLVGTTPARFAEFHRSEIAKWGEDAEAAARRRRRWAEMQAASRLLDLLKQT